MKLGVLAGIALRNLVQARRRTALLSAAIGVVTVLLVLLQSLAGGIEDAMIDAATTVSAGHVNVAGFWKPTPTAAAPFLTDREPIREIIVENTPELDYLVDRHRGWVKVVSETGSTFAALNGLEAEQESRFFETVRVARTADYVEEGGNEDRPGSAARLAEPHTILLFAGQAKRLGVGIGDAVTLQAESPGGQTNTLDATVVAVAEDMGFMTSWAVFVPADDVRELYDISETTTGAFWLYLKDIDDAPVVMRRLREVFEAEGYALMDHQPAPYFMKFDVAGGEDWTGQKLDLTTWDDEVSFLTWILTAFNTITWFLVVVLIGIVAVGITNTMWSSVRDRTGEIGTMRAIGMHRRQVLVLILLEAAMLGVFATSVGAGLGAVLAIGIDAAGVPLDIEAVRAILLSDRLRLSVRAGDVAQAIGLLSLFTMLAAIWPARRAASLRPITAIQHVE